MVREATRSNHFNNLLHSYLRNAPNLRPFGSKNKCFDPLHGLSLIVANREDVNFARDLRRRMTKQCLDSSERCATANASPAIVGL